MLSLCYARLSKTYSTSQIILKQHISWVLHGVCVLIFSFLFLVKKKPIHSFFHVFICCFSACGQIGVLSKMFFKKIEKRTGINFKQNYEMPANQRCWRRGLLDVHLHRWQVIGMWLSNGDSDATEEVLSKRHHCVRKSKILLLVHSSKELRKLLIILQGKPLNVSFGMWYDTEDSSICNNEHLALCPPFKWGQWCHTDVHGTPKIGFFFCSSSPLKISCDSWCI